MKKILITILTIILTCATTVTVAMAISDSKNNVSWEDVNLPENAFVYDSYDLPARKVTVDGVAYDSRVKLVCPTGESYVKTANLTSVKLEAAGTYKLAFTATDKNGEVYFNSESFVVSDKFWVTRDKLSNIQYGKPANAEKTSGLMVNLAKNDTVLFNKTIDLSNIDKNTVLVEGFITPTKAGTADFNRIFIKFTDVYDESNNVTVRGARYVTTESWANGITYWNAYAEGQKPTGRENANKIHKDSMLYGTPIDHSFISVYNTTTKAADYTNFRIQIDPETQTVYIANGVTTKLVACLSDPEFFPGEPLWKGFKSNKVKVTVWADDIQNEKANFCISKVYGYDDLNVENKYQTEEKPIITVDIDKTVTDGNRYTLKAIKGGRFPLPSATAFSEIYGDVDVFTEVIYNYQNPEYAVTAQIEDGKVITDMIGTYAIVFTATDRVGNVTKVEYYFDCVANFDEEFVLTLDGNGQRNAFCGENVFVDGYDVNGGNGKVYASVDIVASNAVNVVAVRDGKFKPETAGTWQVEYIATDYSGKTDIKSYSVNVTVGSEHIFDLNEIVFPKYLISGYEYDVFNVNAYNYKNNKTVAASMIITDANGTKEYKAGQKFKPVVNADSDKISLKFKADNIESDVKEIPVIKNTDADGKFMYKNMFVSENMNKENTDSGMIITAENEGEMSFVYGNPIVMNAFVLVIGGLQGKDDFDNLTVTLEDSLNADIQTSFTITNVKGKKANVTFGNLHNAEILQGFALDGENIISVGYNNDVLTIGNASGKFIKTLKGEAFNGFPSGKAYVSLTLSGAKAGNGVLIKTFDNTTITTTSRDRISPHVAVNGAYGGKFFLNDEYVINPAVVSDTLDPNPIMTLTVTDNDGNVVTTKDGIKLENADPYKTYTMVLAKLGTYTFTYTAKDSANNGGLFEYYIDLFDEVAPVVKVNMPKTSTAKLGSKVNLPDVIVSDDYSSQEEITVFRTVRTPDGTLIVFGFDYQTDENGKSVQNKYAFRYNKKGVYEFNILVTDKAGNQTLVQYKVTVE